MSMHPEYNRKMRRASVVGSVAIFIGAAGVFLPFLPGLLFILLGVSVLSLYSRFMHHKLAELRARHVELVKPLERLESWICAVLDLTTHSREYLHVPVRNGASVAALVERSEIVGEGVAVLAHGASGTMETALSQAIAEVFRKKGYTVVRFDASHGINALNGSFATFTPSNYLEDLEDVCAWVRQQVWATAPLTLVGHSIGALVVGTYAARNPEGVAAVYLVSPTVSGAWLRDVYRATDPAALAEWEENKIRPIVHPLSGETFGLGYGFLEDALQYDLVRDAKALTMPVRVYRGSMDTGTTQEAYVALLEALGGNATGAVLEGLPHTPLRAADIQTLVNALS